MPWLPRQESKTWGAARRGQRERPTGTGLQPVGYSTLTPWEGLPESLQPRGLLSVSDKGGRRGREPVGWWWWWDSDPGHSAFGSLASWQSSGAATGFQVFP